MSAWWIAGIAAAIALETALAWHSWRHHRIPAEPPIYCLGLRPTIPRTGYCAKLSCPNCHASRQAGAALRAAHPEVFGQDRGGQP